MQIINEQKGEFTLSTERNKMDDAAIHDFLSNHAYWCRNISLDKLQKAMDHSINFGIFYQGRQAAYARIISDCTTIAYLGDVFVHPDFRGQGLSKWMMEKIMSHPELQGLRRWILLTKDAHELYQKYGWSPIASPEKWMEIHNPDVYSI